MTPQTAPARAPETPDATPTRARTALSVALLAVLYLWVFPYHALVNNPNENVRVYMTVAMVDDHTFAINRVERDWGYVNDKATRNGKLYSSKAPGTSYLGVPAYWLLTRLTGRDSHALTPAQVRAGHKPPLERTTIVYVLRLWSNVLPALLFAWFFHRFLGRHTRVPALREAVFFSTMAGSLMFAYSEVFASHAHNAFAAMGALMALATVRERDAEARAAGAPGAAPAALGPMFLAGLLGAAATMFEYPAAIATLVVALLILATGVERRPHLALAAVALAALGAKLFASGHRAWALAAVAGAAVAYAATLSPRALARLAAAGAGGAIPTFATMFFHKRAFGDWFKPGYSYLENAQFQSEISQGFFGATKFSWESGIRLWLDPAFGLIPMTAIYLAAVLGFAAYLSWRPPPRWVWPVRALLAVACAFAAVKVAAAVPAIRAANWAGPAAERAVWVAWLVVALIALGSVCLPRPTRHDAALGAAMLLICYGLTRLIGMMNNWRGGWQVGPRYLATLAPLLGLAALAGLDAFAQGSRARRRTATVFAGGATVHAMLASGLPSAYFPHVPTEFVSPLFELFFPLVRGGLAPHNAGRYLFHWEGLRGMIPFFVAAAVVAAMVLRGDERRPLAVAAHVLGGAAVALFLLVPLAAVARYEHQDVTRWVRTQVWEPRPAAAGTPRPAAAAGRGSPEALREHGRKLAESGDAAGALEAFRRAAQQAR